MARPVHFPQEQATNCCHRHRNGQGASGSVMQEMPKSNRVSLQQSLRYAVKLILITSKCTPPLQWRPAIIDSDTADAHEADLLDERPVRVFSKGHSASCVACACCPANAVQVGVQRPCCIVVDDSLDALYVQAPGGHICSQQECSLSLVTNRMQLSQALMAHLWHEPSGSHLKNKGRIRRLHTVPVGGALCNAEAREQHIFLYQGVLADR